MDFGPLALQSIASALVSQPWIDKIALLLSNRLRQTLDGWGAVIEAIRSDATIFADNRPGYGKSDAAQTPRDGCTIVEDLRSTLRLQGLEPPYLLVGHSRYTPT